MRHEADFRVHSPECLGTGWTPSSWEEAVWTRRVSTAKTPDSPAAAPWRRPRCYVCKLLGHLPHRPIVLRLCSYSPGFSHTSSFSRRSFTLVQVPEASLLDYASLICRDWDEGIPETAFSLRKAIAVAPWENGSLVCTFLRQSSREWGLWTFGDFLIGSVGAFLLVLFSDSFPNLLLLRNDTGILPVIRVRDLCFGPPTFVLSAGRNTAVASSVALLPLVCLLQSFLHIAAGICLLQRLSIIK